jgi:hypothetical protein
MWNARNYREFKEKKIRKKKREFKEKNLSLDLSLEPKKRNTTNKIKYKEVKYLKKHVFVFQKLRK